MASPSVTQVYLIEIRCVPAAAVFAALYLIFMVGLAVQMHRFKNCVYQFMEAFCMIRLTSFILRGVIAGSTAVHTGLLVGEEILISVGLFYLLRAVYWLIRDREALYCRAPLNTSHYSRIARSLGGILYHLLLIVAVVLGSVAIAYVYTSDDASIISYGNSLQLASTVIFLALTVFLAYQAIVLFMMERKGNRCKASHVWNLGSQFGAYILMAISILLIVREVFAVSTALDRVRANNEHLWYPLQALPELLVVMLFAIPGLVPSLSELFLVSEPTVVLEKTPVAPAPIIPAPSTQAIVPQSQALIDEPSKLDGAPLLPFERESNIPPANESSSVSPHVTIPDSRV